MKGLSQMLKIEELTPAAQKLVSAIMERVAEQEWPERLAKMALIMCGQNQKSDAKKLAQAARDLSSNNYRVRVMTDWLNRHQAPLWHFQIIHDNIRNEVYAAALNRFVKPGMVVFEIGTGTGILAMLAAQAGARHVYTCERRPEVAKASKEIIARNGFADRITVIAKDANAVQIGIDLPEKADLFVAEIVDNSLLGEGVLPLTDLAKTKFLKPGAVLLPQSVSAMGYLISGEGYSQNYRVDQVMGFDLTPFNCFKPTSLNASRGGGDVRPLSGPVELIRFDLSETAPKEYSHIVSLMANQTGQAESLMRWLRLDFGDGIIFENRPPQKSSWDPQLHIFPETIDVVLGRLIEVEVSHNREQLFVFPISS